MYSSCTPRIPALLPFPSQPLIQEMDFFRTVNNIRGIVLDIYGKLADFLLRKTGGFHNGASWDDAFRIIMLPPFKTDPHHLFTVFQQQSRICHPKFPIVTHTLSPHPVFDSPCRTCSSYFLSPASCLMDIIHEFPQKSIKIMAF